MRLSNLFVIPAPASREQFTGEADRIDATAEPTARTARSLPRATSSGDGQIVFLTPQALASYPGAACGVSVVVGLCKVLFPGISPQATAWVTLAASLFISLLMLLVGLDGENPADREKRSRLGWILMVAMALLNGLVLAAAATGVVTTAAGV